jgi:excisionase family DNA binding protein
VNDGPRFLTPDDVAAELACSRVQVMALLRSGDLPAVKIGGRGHWRVERPKLEQWIADQYAKTRDIIDSGDGVAPLDPTR